jgi:alkylation response protein AidB-like acyl-CoA dehydrogenase
MSVPSSALQTGQDPLDLPDSLRLDVTSATDEIEDLGKIPEKLVRKLRDSGAFRLLTPCEMGGTETTLTTALRVYEKFGQLDTAVGWNVWNHNFGFIAALLGESGIERIWAAGEEPILANCTAPARAVVTDDGFLVSGTWKMVSGVDAADWLVALGVVIEGGRPRQTEAGIDIRYLLLPRDHLTIRETWKVSGMRGTGANNVEVDNAYVPAELTVPVTKLPRYDRPLYRIPSHYLVSAGCTAVLLGTAQTVIDEFVELAPGKRVLEGGMLADRATVQVRIATSQTALYAARALLFEITHGFDTTAQQGDELTIHQRSLLHAAQSHAAIVCRDVLMAMHEIGGSASVYLGSRFERFIRDGLVALQHVNHSAQFLEDVGRVRLGMPPRIPLF